MSDRWRERLSEYVDGELRPAEKAALEEHLEGCPACRDDLDAVRGVVARLDASVDRAPARDLWPRIEERLPASGGRWSTGLRLAAALGGVVVLAASIWLSRADRTPAVEPAAATVAVPGATDALARASDAWQDHLAERRLPAPLAEPMTDELAAFDRAIAETRRALAADPADPDLQAHLARTLEARVRFLARLGQWTGAAS